MSPAARILVVDDDVALDLRMPNMDGHTFLRRLAPLAELAALLEVR